MKQFVLKLVLSLGLLAGAAFAQSNPYCTNNTWTGGAKDSFASLPQMCMSTDMAHTPAPNPPKTIKATDNLSTAVSTAQCGDVLLLDPTYKLNGPLILAFPNCDPNHWVILRTATPDSLLPAENYRITPSWAGVSSLPGRWPYTQSSTPTVNLMPTLIPTSSISVSGSYFRVIGLNITRPAGGSFGNLISLKAGTHDFVFDRNWIHGNGNDETTRGIAASNTFNAAFINNFFTDFHCRSVSGACTDSQALLFGLDTTVQGQNIKVVNNFIESAGEGIIFGGGAATFTPTDSIIANNLFFKPMTWNPSYSGYNGGTAGADGVKHPWLVKNHLEFKNANRVLVEGNQMSNVWGGFSQVGAAGLATPKNQSGPNGTNLCPICMVQSITYRFNKIQYMGQTLQIGCGPSDNGGLPLACGYISAHDNVFDHVQYSYCYGCGNGMTLIGSSPAITNPMLGYVNFSHNTVLNDGSVNATLMMMFMGGPSSVKEPSIVMNNNILATGTAGMYSSGSSGTFVNCASGSGHYNPADKVASCWDANSSFTGNVLMTAGYTGGTVWPAGNYFVSSWAALGMLGNYSLPSTSPFYHKATDGTNPGANISNFNTALSNIKQ